ncbi:MAG: TIGR02117 family protein [Gemmataceae bacterium]|nr:TIGR02117 family protein [Gemmataceae bacterium]MDW8264597.1 TIGR02117 family protein [Gemmataceae bacterium]
MGDISRHNQPRRRRAIRWLIRCLAAVIGVVLAPGIVYFLIALVGLIPVNNDFSPTPNGIEIIVTSDILHAELVLPIRNEVVDWTEYFPASDFAGDVSGATHVAVSWGDREFYLSTPTWADTRADTVLRALFWPTVSCAHVSLWFDYTLPPRSRKTTLSSEQYRRLVRHVLGTLQLDESGRPRRIVGAAYGPADAFYEAHGYYHACNTCNSWVGRGLKAAGVRIGWFTPLPGSVLWYLPASRDETPEGHDATRRPVSPAGAARLRCGVPEGTPHRPAAPPEAIRHSLRLGSVMVPS